MTQTDPEPIYLTACGGKIKDTSEYPSAEYHGKQIYFCTRACLRVFELDQDAFMAGKVEHPLEED